MSFPCDVWKAALGPDSAGPQWRKRLTGLPALRTRSCGRLLVVTPHLDEDVCSAGGLIAVVAGQSVPIEVLAVTDGNGAQKGRPDAGHPAELGYRRAHRSVSDRRLGAHQTRRHALCLQSGRVSEHEADVVAALSEIVGSAREPTGLWVLAPWHHDGHPDHDAVGRAAVVVCTAYRLRLVQYLTAAWRRDDPADLPRRPLRHLPLSPLVRARKLRAIPTPLRGRGQVCGREFFLTGAAGATDG